MLGWGIEEFEDYLNLHPKIPEDLFEPVDISDKEKLIKKKFSGKKYSDEEFADLSEGEKVLYIENGGEINYEKWQMLNGTQRQLDINAHPGSLDYRIVSSMKSSEKRQYDKRQKQYLGEKIKLNAYREYDNKYVIELSNRYGVYDSGKEEWVVEPKYYYIRNPNDKGISQVNLDGKWGF